MGTEVEKYSTSKTFRVTPVIYNNNNPPVATTIPSTPDNADNNLPSSTTESLFKPWNTIT
ncbi:MAG TPA: hypothetical protein VEH06_13065 [Candidatus Bathyarchaeia archaeon]|nr:hypothetical protein [Candidatus Bathyarchaeia archaeon]